MAAQDKHGSPPLLGRSGLAVGSTSADALLHTAPEGDPVERTCDGCAERKPCWMEPRSEATLCKDCWGDATISVGVLREHYLAGIECDHDMRADRASCACSLVDLGWQPNVGAAVESWVQHVMEVEDAR